MQRAMIILRQYYPEYYNHRPSISIADTGKDLGNWDPITGNIALSKIRFGGTLTPEAQDLLLETLAHEYWHSNHPWRTLWDQLVDPEHRYVDKEIERRLRKNDYDAMHNKPICK